MYVYMFVHSYNKASHSLCHCAVMFVFICVEDKIVMHTTRVHIIPPTC